MDFFETIRSVRSFRSCHFIMIEYIFMKIVLFIDGKMHGAIVYLTLVSHHGPGICYSKRYSWKSYKGIRFRIVYHLQIQLHPAMYIEELHRQFILLIGNHPMIQCGLFGTRLFICDNCWTQLYTAGTGVIQAPFVNFSVGAISDLWNNLLILRMTYIFDRCRRS